MPVLVLVVCGAPLTQRVGDMTRTLTDAGWKTYVVGTPASASWIDKGTRAELGMRFEFRTPTQAKRIPSADALTVCPATFNTTNKIVAGIADNYAVSLVCESIGNAIPTIMVPMANNKLWGHLGWQRSLAALAGSGVRLLDVHTGGSGTSPVQSGTGDEVVRDFRAAWLVKALEPFR
jgi:phosphopantothenoylcysteine synthetase/decarboxylase